MPLKIELKPGERVIVGDCVVTNAGPRTRLMIEGRVPILRQKEIMTPRRANSPAKRIYLAVQLVYTSRGRRDHCASYLRLAHDLLHATPGARPYVARINNLILTGELYKALKETRKLIAFEEDEMNQASKAYGKTAKEIAPPRELEASLLLKAAAKLQAVRDSWKDKKQKDLNDALLYNRRLWTVFIDSVAKDDNQLPIEVRSNIANLGVYVLGETFSLMTNPKPAHLESIIKINRSIAAGLGSAAA